MNDMTGGFPVDAAVAANFRLLQDVDVKLTVEIGSTQLTLRELLALGESSVIELDRQANELLDVFVNGTLIGRGEVVTVGDRFGVRMTELVNPDKRAADRPMMWSYILKLVVLLPLVCGLMIGCLYLWRRLESRMPGKPGDAADRGQGDDDDLAGPAPRGARFRGQAAARLGRPRRRDPDRQGRRRTDASSVTRTGDAARR